MSPDTGYPWSAQPNTLKRHHGSRILRCHRAEAERPPLNRSIGEFQGLEWSTASVEVVRYAIQIALICWCSTRLQMQSLDLLVAKIDCVVFEQLARFHLILSTMRAQAIPLPQRPKWVIIPPLAAFESGRPALRACVGKVSCVRWVRGVVTENAWVFGASVPSTADRSPAFHRQTIRIDLLQIRPGPSHGPTTSTYRTCRFVRFVSDGLAKFLSPERSVNVSIQCVRTHFQQSQPCPPPPRTARDLQGPGQTPP
ncbi:hypothetical protein QBC34DRAFT_169567 [Podospora aff. communis PSN243]|uniref:Uncharacterized protein n=1 Tax=Podospora aff. communis PSN243 TaxID=3040156 RepID=A0AAV9G8A5_9PEZI|nr:hypothetical protein QBC34DRAFT_169567 [Podospora aff. communis PSN243]